MRKFLITTIFFLLLFSLRGQYSLILSTYNQDFTSLGTGDLVGVTDGDLGIIIPSLTGWFFLEDGTNQNTTITANDGSTTNGDTYNFGTTAATDRTLGGLQSGNLIPSFGFWFTNNTGSVITSITITYTGEQWRLGNAARVDMLDFEYSFNANRLDNGNWISADVLDFTAPETTGVPRALDGNAISNRTVLSGTIIGLTIPIGRTCFIRWIDLDASGSDDGLGIDDFTLTANFTPASTHFFRSFQSGDWNILSTWESSPDGIVPYLPATAIPDFNANTITILNTHTVTVNSFPIIDQVVIQSGGILNYTGGTITIQDGAGDDLDIQTGGVFNLAVPSSAPLFGTGTPTISIATGGILRISAAGLTGAGVSINANNYIYQHQSILEYTLNGGFSSSNVVFFPNANSTTIPIFRTTATAPTIMLVGSNNPTTFNGVFECAGDATIRWQNPGNKVFRNGIRGIGNIDFEAASIGIAKFIINGTTAELGGTGSLIVPPIGGLEIGTPTLVTMSSNKTVTGNIALLNASQINLGAFDLTVTETISNATVTSYVRTNGIGKLSLSNVASGLSGKLFPIGLSTINPLFIQSTPTTSYSARVVEPITPTIYNSSQAVLRSWNISTPATAPSAFISFGYTFNPPTECGPFYSNIGPAEVGVNIGNVWNIHQTNLVPAAFPFVPGTFIVTPTAPINYFNGTTSEFPFVIANNGAVLSVDYNIIAQAQKINNTSRISWKVFTTNSVSQFEVQRATGNGIYQTIASINPTPLLDYDFTDLIFSKGVNQYRIKVIRQNGAIAYSNIVAIISDSKGLLITTIAPNPVQSYAYLTISSGKAASAQFNVYDITGKLVKYFQRNIAEGSTVFPLDMTDLATGLYYIMATTAESKAVFRFSKQ